MSPSEVSRADSNEKHSPFVGWWTSPRSVAFVAIAIAVIATAVAIAAWLRPGASHSYSDQESAQAKVNVCSAWAPVHQAVWAGTPTRIQAADGGAFDELSVLKEVPARTMATGFCGVSYPDQIPSVVLTSWDRSGVRMAGGIVNLLC
jgi:drug/metabolite transporter superfamily protein YnfA